MKSLDSDRVLFLATEILRHKRLYYGGKPEISDVNYDRIEDELRKLSPDHPVLTLVGTDQVETANAKVVHDHPMLSLSKTYSIDELRSWVGRETVVGSLKVDGSSISLVYREGKLLVGKTRGNGREGEDVTSKLRWVSDVMLQIEAKGSVEVRGELFCRESQFVKLAEEMQSLGLEKPTSPRNIVAGVLGRKTHANLARYFNFFAFDVLGVSDFRSEYEKSQWLALRGFNLPSVKLLKDFTSVERYLGDVKRQMEEDEVGCDGAVFTYNNLSLHEELGVTSHHPRYKQSFKWQGETARSKIQRIEWATSRLGIVTPVAVIEPVNLSGATITNITLHNAAHVRSYQLKPGDEIELVRSGEVIPKFLSVVKSAAGHADLPSQCPSCRTELTTDDVRLKCPNISACPAQLSGVVLNWIRATDIEDLSEKRLQQMIDLGLVRTAADLYRLSLQDLLRLPATKEKMANKLWSNIQKSKDLPLPQFLNGLGIEGAGRTTWEKIVEDFKSLERIRNLDVGDLESLEGFAEKSATQIVLGLRRLSEMIDELLAVGVKPKSLDAAPKSSDVLSGMQFVITGALSKPRAEVESLIKANGGKISSSVSKNTTVLLTNETDSHSSKMEKAKLLKVKVWSEGEFLRQLQTLSKN